MQLAVQSGLVRQGPPLTTKHTSIQHHIKCRSLFPSSYKIQVAGPRPSSVPLMQPTIAANASAVIASSAAPPPYGWLMVSVAFTAFAIQWMAINVAIARKEAGVKYPAMVADAAVVGEKAASKFNCAQRGHLNTLENLPVFLVMELLIAQVFPMTAAALGALWTIGRIVYVVGYTNGGPSKRMPGAAISNLTMIATTFILTWVGYSLLRA